MDYKKPYLSYKKFYCIVNLKKKKHDLLWKRKVKQEINEKKYVGTKPHAFTCLKTVILVLVAVRIGVWRTGNLDSADQTDREEMRACIASA